MARHRSRVGPSASRRSLSDEPSPLKARLPMDVASCACGPAGGTCVLQMLNASGCALQPTDAAASLWAGAHCLSSSAKRGVFVISRATDRRPVCTAGDEFIATVTSERLRFTSLSQAAPAAPSVYWMDLSASALADAQSLELHIALTETLRRDLAGAADAASSFDLALWLRYSQCSWRHVTRGSIIEVPPSPRPSREPACGALPADGARMGYLKLQHPETCDGGTSCDGDALHQLLNTSNLQRCTPPSRFE